MTKRLSLAVTLLLCGAVLCSCSSNDTQDSGKRYDVLTGNAAATQVVLPVSTDAPTAVPDTETLTVAAGEEAWDYVDTATDEPVTAVAAPANQGLSTEPTVAPTFSSEYAGATPVVIDPIDKPTPTPLPTLTFEYAVYDANNVHLTFQGPAGWTISNEASNIYSITNPDPSMDYGASLTVQVTSVSAQMTAAEMKTQVQSYLSSLRSVFASFSPSNTASRTLLDNEGVYANYTASMSDGTQVAGRVHVTCIGKTMYVLHVTYPRGYTDTYKEVLYDTFRHSVKYSQ